MSNSIKLVPASGNYKRIVVGALTVMVKADDEGVVVDIFATKDINETDSSEPVASTWATYSEGEE
jgi:hypothetical protein